MTFSDVFSAAFTFTLGSLLGLGAALFVIMMILGALVAIGEWLEKQSKRDK